MSAPKYKGSKPAQCAMVSAARERATRVLGGWIQRKLSNRGRGIGPGTHGPSKGPEAQPRRPSGCQRAIRAGRREPGGRAEPSRARLYPAVGSGFPLPRAARSRPHAAPLRPERRPQQRRCGSSALRCAGGAANAEWLSPIPDPAPRVAGPRAGQLAEIRRQAAVEVRRRVAAGAPRRLASHGGASAHSLRTARCVSDTRAAFCLCAATARCCVLPQRCATARGVAQQLERRRSAPRHASPGREPQHARRRRRWKPGPSFCREGAWV